MKRLGLLLLATVFALLVPSSAWAAVPTDPRVAAAVKAWQIKPLYVDSRYSSVVDSTQEAELLRKIQAAPVPVFVAVLPTGAWFQEDGDTALLAGWLAATNGKPGIYLVMDGHTTYGVDHQVAAYAPRSTWAKEARESMSNQLAAYLDEVEVGDRYEAGPARTEPIPPRPERTYPKERFTVGKALGNGFGGAALGALGGSLLAGGVLAVAAMSRQRGGRL